MSLDSEPRRAWALALASVVLLSFPVGHVHAQPSSTDADAARELMFAGREKYDAEQFADALQRFRSADAIMKVPSTRLWVARAEQKLGRWVEARATYQSLLDMPERKPSEPEAFVTAREEAKQKLAELDDLLPQLTLELVGASATEVEVRVGDEVWGADKLGVAVQLNPGRYDIQARTKDGQSQLPSQTVELGQEARQTLRLAFPARSSAVPTPGANPPPPKPAPTDSAEGFQVSPVAWVGFAVGGAGLIVGSVFGGLALSDSSELDCPDDLCPREQEDLFNRTQTFSHVSTAGFVVAGVGLALGVIGLTVLSGPEESDVGLTLTPGGAWVTGAF